MMLESEKELSRKQIKAGEAPAKALCKNYTTRQLAEGYATEAIRDFIYECACNPSELGHKAAISFLHTVWSEYADLSQCNLVSEEKDPKAMTTIIETLAPGPEQLISSFVAELQHFTETCAKMLEAPDLRALDEEETEEVNSAGITEAPSVEDAHISETAIRRDSESSGEHSATSALDPAAATDICTYTIEPLGLSQSTADMVA